MADNSALKKLIWFEPECYVVRGVDSLDQPWISRRLVSKTRREPGVFASLELARRQSEADVQRMNSLGANVRMVRQELSEDLLWHDAENSDA